MATNWLILVGVVALVSAIATLVSAARYPDEAFRAVGTSKILWIVLPIIGIFLCGLVSIVTAIVWFANFKPRVEAAAR